MKFGYYKHWNSFIFRFSNYWVFQTLKLGILAQQNIAILHFSFSKQWNCEFGFSKHWNCEIWLFQTLDFFIFAFFKHWSSDFEQKNSGFLPLLTFFYPKRGSALRLENISGQNSFYKTAFARSEMLKFAMSVLFIS